MKHAYGNVPIIRASIIGRSPLHQQRRLDFCGPRLGFIRTVSATTVIVVLALGRYTALSIVAWVSITKVHSK